MYNLHSERFRRLFKEAFWIVLGQVMAVVGSLVGVKLITGLLNPNEYGDLALGMTFAMLINQLVLGPLSNGITRFYAPAFEQSDLHGYLKAVRRLLFIATGIIVVMLAFAVFALIVVKRTDWILIATASFVFAIFSGYNSILSGVQNAARQRSLVALFQGLDPWTRFLIAAVLLLCLGASSFVAMVGYVFASVLIFVSQYLFFHKSFISKINIEIKDNKWQEKIWKFSWPFATYGILTWTQLSSDRWALKLYTSSREVGLYAALYQLGYYPMSLATGMIGQFLSPIFYQRAGDATDSQRSSSVKKLIWKFTSSSLLLTGFAFLIALLFHSQIFYILVATKYGVISYLLPWMLFSGGVFAAGQILTSNLMINLRTKSIIIVKMATALSGIIFNFVGAYWLGINGIVIASVLFSVIYFIWIVILFYMDGQKVRT